MAMKERKAALRKRIAQDLQKLESEEIERQCRRSGQAKNQFN